MSITLTLTQYVLCSIPMLIVCLGYMYYLWSKGNDIDTDMYITTILFATLWPFVITGSVIVAAGLSVLWVLKKLEIKGKSSYNAEPEFKLHIDKVLNRTNIPKTKTKAKD